MPRDERAGRPRAAVPPITKTPAPIDALRLGPVGRSGRRPRAAAGAPIAQNGEVHEEARDGASAPGRARLDVDFDG